MGIHGINHKITALIINNGFGTLLHLVVNRHLKKIIPLWNWTPKTNPGKISVCIERWLDKQYYGDVN